MVEVPPNNAPVESAPLEAGIVRVEKSRGFFTMARDIGHNIDLINFQARVKDLYKLGDTLSVAVSLGMKRVFSAWNNREAMPNEAAMLKETGSALHEARIAMNAGDSNTANAAMLRGAEINHKHSELRLNHLNDTKNAEFAGKVVTDAVNFGAQLFIARTSNEVEQEKLMKVYEKVVAQELGKTNVSRDELKKSTNPIIQNSVEYYTRKGKYRMLPVWAGLIQVIPLVAKGLSKALEPVIGEKANAIAKSVDWITHFSGVDASLGGMAAYYFWYFSKRQKGAFYQLDDIWDQTEGITTDENRSINRGVNPGTLVTSEKITKLYDEVAKEQNLPAFKVTDPLTNRVFDQIARYLNHHYQSPIYRVKVPNSKLHEELEGSHFTHADLVTLFGTKGIDINDAYATAVRMETLARKGIAEYREVNAAITQITRPEKSRFTDDQAFGVELEAYLVKLDGIAERALGSAWPAPYIKNEIRPEIPKSYGVEPTLLPPEQRLAGPDRGAPRAPAESHADAAPRVPSYAEAAASDAPNEAASLRAKLDDSMQKRSFRERVPAAVQHTANAQAESHAERAEATQGTGVMAL